jgi:hypothetical protein
MMIIAIGLTNGAVNTIMIIIMRSSCIMHLCASAATGFACLLAPCFPPQIVVEGSYVSYQGASKTLTNERRGSPSLPTFGESCNLFNSLLALFRRRAT